MSSTKYGLSEDIPALRKNTGCFDVKLEPADADMMFGIFSSVGRRDEFKEYNDEFCKSHGIADPAISTSCPRDLSLNEGHIAPGKTVYVTLGMNDNIIERKLVVKNVFLVYGVYDKLVDAKKDYDRVVEVPDDKYTPWQESQTQKGQSLASRILKSDQTLGEYVWIEEHVVDSRKVGDRGEVKK